MSNVTRKGTPVTDYRRNANTPDYPAGSWYVNDPVADQLHDRGVPLYYWKDTGSGIAEMTAGEKAAVDTVIRDRTLDAIRDEAAATPDEEDTLGINQRATVAVYNKRDNYLTNRVMELQAALAAIKSSNGPADSIRDAIPPSFLQTATRQRDDAIQDYKDEVNSRQHDQGIVR